MHAHSFHIKDHILQELNHRQFPCLVSGRNDIIATLIFVRFFSLRVANVFHVLFSFEIRVFCSLLSYDCLDTQEKLRCWSII